MHIGMHLNMSLICSVCTNSIGTEEHDSALVTAAIFGTASRETMIENGYCPVCMQRFRGRKREVTRALKRYLKAQAVEAERLTEGTS